MQVLMEMYSNGSWGGGHVAVADCRYDDVSLTWLAVDTLQIGHPASVDLGNAKAEFYLSGRVIHIVYKVDER
jgi:hypothetical protein